MAASGAGVTVLAPNGRRQVVKVTAGTPLLQVLEEVCKKHNFNPREYNLKFQRTVLDLNLQWRFANLPNNAKLEMVSRATQREGAESSKVRVALQLEDGGRLQDEFLCGKTLWDVLHHFPQTRACLDEVAPGSVAVCIYMRDEVSGEISLKQTTLQSLGLTCGSAIIRFVVRKCDAPQSGQQDAKVEMNSTHKADFQSPTAAGVGRSVIGQEERISETSREEPSVKAATVGISTQSESSVEEATFEAMKQEEHYAKPTSSEAAIGELSVKAAPLPAAKTEEASEATKRDSTLETPSKQLTSCVRGVEPSMDAVRPKSSSSQLAQPPTPPQSPMTAFIPFQGGGHRLGGANVPGASFEADLQCATAEEPLQSPEHSKPKKSKTDQRDDGSEAVDREAAVCHMDLDANLYANTQELPDDFFEITVDDVRRRFAELRKERQRLEEAPLMTKALREGQLKEKMERYPKVVLRVLFPDRYILQGFFKVTETVKAVRKYVQSHLEEPATPFYLFITPPRTELKDDSQNLFQAQLFPAAVVHFGSPEKCDHYLQQKLLREAMSPSQADALVARAIPRAPATSTAPVLESLAGPSSEVSRRAPENYEEEAGISDSHQQVQRDLGKVPKWLKLSGKK